MLLNLTGISAAIFDMDGTMVDNALFHRCAWREFLRRRGIDLSDREYDEKISGGFNTGILKKFFGVDLSPALIEQYAEEKEVIYRELFTPHLKEVAGLVKFINELEKRGIKLAIASTAPPKNRELVLKSLGLQGKFPVIVGDEHVSHGKPDPEIYLKTAQELGVSPAACIAFEDSPRGIESARRAGMRVVAVLTGHIAGELTGAESCVRDFTELLHHRR